MVEGEISFGRFRLNLARRELRRDNAPVRLGRRALDILCVLASAGGAVVSKDELMAQVWAGVVVEENNLQVHISALRKALEGDSNEESWIVTVPGRGYRLLRSREPPAAADPAPGRSLPAPDKPSIAVLPFLNLSGDPEQEYFADGMVEEIITALSHIRWLFVIARNSSFTYKAQASDVKRVGRELGVRYVLEGSVRKSGNRVRITAQLIDAETGGHLWADHFEAGWKMSSTSRTRSLRASPASSSPRWRRPKRHGRLVGRLPTSRLTISIFAPMRWLCRRQREPPRRFVCLSRRSSVIRVTDPPSLGPHSAAMRSLLTTAARIRPPTV